MALITESSIKTQGKTGSLKDELTAALPEGFQCKVRYVHTAPKRCDPIFSTPPGFEPGVTRLASHFLTVSIDPASNTTKTSASGLFIFGIEALVYSTKRLTTIFVSKADSTGYSPLRKPSPLKVITTTFVHWLATNEQSKHPARKLVISLFARSQTQYLFPGSAENSNKHVLDDRQLIKWWVRVLEPRIPNQNHYKVLTETDKSEYDGYITVPGYEGLAELRPFLPLRKHSSNSGVHWNPGNPLTELAKARGIPEDAPTRCLLPRFPDDPKARFMLDLDDEAGLSEGSSSTISPSKQKNGKWTSIRDLDRFWEAMGFRQECSSGRVVGFLWLINRSKAAVATEAPEADLHVGALDSDPLSPNKAAIMNGSSVSKQRRKPLSGPIIPRQPRLKGVSSSLTASDLTGMVDVEAGNGLVLTADGYDKAMHTLLHLDFANVEVATHSTSKWIAEVSQICGIQTDWALEITGTAKLEEGAGDASSKGNLGVNQVNDLGGMVRKKRKAEDLVVSEGQAAAETQLERPDEERPSVNLLGAGMVRKKPKPAVA